MRLSDNFSNKKMLRMLLPLMLVVLIMVALPSVAQDAAGTKTGTINDVTAATAGKPTLQEIGDQAGHNKIAINIMWTLITGFLGNVHAGRFCHG